jgi:hypothetical protein
MPRSTRFSSVFTFSAGLLALATAASALPGCGDGDAADEGNRGTSSAGKGGSSGSNGAQSGSAGSDSGASGSGREGGTSNQGGSTSEGGSGNQGDAGSAGGSENEAGSGNQAGSSNEAGAGGTAGSGNVDEDPLFVAGGWLTTPDEEYIGYLALLSDISAASSVDLSTVVEFPGDIAYGSPGDGSVCVVLATEPTIQRWVLDENEELVLDDEVGLAQYGVGAGVRKSAPIFVAADRAYYFDHDTLQLITWNPSTMQTTEAILLDGLEEEGFGMRTNYLHQDGDRLLVSASYWRLTDEEGYLKLNRVAIVDTSTHDVIYADDTRCGGVAFQAMDSNGHLYLASHPGHTAALSVGMAHTEGVSEPAESCIIRVQAGADTFDQDYYVDLNELSGGFTGGIMQGPGDEAYVLTYDGPALTTSDYFRAPRSDAWAIHSITLGSEAESYALVPDMPLVSGYGLAFATEVGGERTPFIIGVKGDLSEGAYYDASDPGAFEKALTLPGFPGPALRIR